MAANVHIASVWLLTFGSSTTATLAIRASDPLGYDRSVQSGARFVSSMWFHRLPAEKVFSDEEVDARLFHRPVDVSGLLTIPDFVHPRWVGLSTQRSNASDSRNTRLGTRHSVAESVSVVQYGHHPSHHLFHHDCSDLPAYASFTRSCSNRCCRDDDDDRSEKNQPSRCRSFGTFGHRVRDFHHRMDSYDRHLHC